jgi:hypothetical protein
MITQISIPDKIHALETIFRSGYQNNIVERMVDKIIALERDKAQRDLAELQARLKQFETEYQMTSDNFYQRFHKGELGDGADFFEWSAFYKMYQSVCERLANLEFGSA